MNPEATPDKTAPASGQRRRWLTLGLGGYLSGFAGRLVGSFGFATAFLSITGFTGVVFVLAIFLRAPLARLDARAGVSL